MRIPTSVIVMSVVTAVPFGLGIRDTLKKKDVSAEEFDGDDSGRSRYGQRSRELEEYEAEMRREQLEREAKSREKLAQLDQLIGDRPAQMGSLFDGITLGAGAGSFQPENVRRRIENATRDGFMLVTFDADAATLNGVTVNIYSDYQTEDACEKMAEKLGDAWGKSPTMSWLDKPAHQRATFDTVDCKLTFERYLEPAEWVAQLPLNAVGMSADKFSETLGPAADYEEDRIYWNIPGITFGHGVTKLEAYATKGKIVGFKATVSSDFDSTVAVRDALSAKLKAEPKKASGGDEYDDYSDANIWQWKRRVPVSLEQLDTDRFSVAVGKMPWD
jgi:hypothetical protein